MLVWLCILSVLLFAFAACVCHVCRVVRDSARHVDVAGSDAKSSPMSPNSAGISTQTDVYSGVASPGPKILVSLTRACQVK